MWYWSGWDNPPCWMCFHSQGARLHLWQVHQGDGIPYPIAQPLFGDGTFLLPPSKTDEQLLRTPNFLCVWSTLIIDDSSKGSSCVFTTWSWNGSWSGRNLEHTAMLECVMSKFAPYQRKKMYSSTKEGLSIGESVLGTSSGWASNTYSPSSLTLHSVCVRRLGTGKSYLWRTLG